EVSALTDARKTLAYDFFRILRAPRGKQEFIIAELDSEIRKIRLKLTDSYEEGVRLSSGTFTLPARFCREILPDDVRSITIILEKSDDEWWYGSY
ncbi:hypothetical protein, partial [Salmonella enterica]|uniref:hypothetical protein n=2 Tax=Enterobacteriaceae TaxID=543 RepID=UPI0029676443